MQRIIGVTELQRAFRRVFNEVAEDGVPYVLTRGSRPEAALIPYEDFLRFQEWEEQTALMKFDRLMARLEAQTTAMDEAEIAADVAAARTETAE